MRLKLKDFRQTHRIYQAELAAMLGTTQSTISRMELTPTAELTSSQYQVLCDRFGKEDVDSFRTDRVSVDVSGNSVSGRSRFETNVNVNEVDVMTRIAEAVIRLSEKQAEQTDKILSLMEKIERML